MPDFKKPLVFGCFIFTTFLFAQQFAIEKDYYVLWDRKIPIINGVSFNLNDYPILLNEDYKVYKQIVQPQFRELVYPNLGVVLTIRKDYLKKKLPYKKIESISIPYNLEGSGKFWFKGNKRIVQMNNYFSSPISIYGQNIYPLIDYDDVFGDSSSIVQYMDRTIYADPKKPGKSTVILHLDHFYITMLFGKDEKLFFLYIITR